MDELPQAYGAKSMLYPWLAESAWAVMTKLWPIGPDVALRFADAWSKNWDVPAYVADPKLGPV